jgi:hypothetical protein
MTPAATDAAEKKRKKKRPSTGTEPLARQSVYIAKMHRAHHGKTMTISAQALGELERIFDFTTDALLHNCKGSMKYLKTKQINLKVAHGAAGLTLTGRLKENALGRGSKAVAAFEAKADPAA